MSTINLCADASRQGIAPRAYHFRMGTTLTDRTAEHRKRIAAYIRLVMDEKGWSQAAVARALNVNQSTMNRAANGKHTTSFESLLALEEAAGVPMPEDLKASARALRMREPPSAEEVRGIVDLVDAAPLDEQRAAYEMLALKFGGRN